MFVKHDAQEVLFGIALSLSYVMSIADIERLNRRTKVVLTTENTKFAHYAAKHFLEEVRLVSKRAASCAEALTSALGGAKVGLSQSVLICKLRSIYGSALRTHCFVWRAKRPSESGVFRCACMTQAVAPAARSDDLLAKRTRRPSGFDLYGRDRKLAVGLAGEDNQSLFLQRRAGRR